LAAAGRLAKALRFLKPEEAEVVLRQVVERALRQGDHRNASAMTSDLVGVLRDSGRLREALEEAQPKAEPARQAGLGPWTQLSDQGQRLQILAQLGEYEQVLGEVEELRRHMAELPEEGGANEAVEPWNVRELLLDTGRSAALRLERWEDVLAFV